MPNALDQIESDISRTRDQLESLQAKLVDLERAAELLRPYYRFSPIVDGAKPTRNVGGMPPLVSQPRTEPHLSGMVRGSIGLAPEDERPDQDLAGITILEAAQRILSEAGGEYRGSEEIAREAMSRGYKSTSTRNPESDPQKIINSFYVTMKRNQHIFQQDRRRFKLISRDEGTSEQAE